MGEPTYAVIALPSGAGFENKTKPRAFTGVAVGHFFVHQGTSDDGYLILSDDDYDMWHVTHLRSGYAAQKGIPNVARGVWLAQQLLAFPCWDADTKDGVRALIDNDTLAAIMVLRADATSGDCHGTFSGESP